MGKAEIYKELAEKDMLTKCYNRNAYNEQSKNVHMQIASGYAQFDAGMDMDLDNTRSRADERMYENKRQMKAGKVINGG